MFSKYHRFALGICALSLTLAGAAEPAMAQTVSAAQTRPYSVAETTIATLLDDPEAADILKRLIPTVYANDMFQTMGRPQTLKAVQQYEPAALSDDVLTQIQAELDKLPAPK